MSKKQLNEWNDDSFKKLPKRWSKNYNKPDGTGLTEFEKTTNSLDKLKGLKQKFSRVIIGICQEQQTHTEDTNFLKGLLPYNNDMVPQFFYSFGTHPLDLLEIVRSFKLTMLSAIFNYSGGLYRPYARQRNKFFFICCVNIHPGNGRNRQEQNQ